ncbi:peptidase inhibitor family I36 protein [Streptomyces sp. NPDC050523]|uniref:peptidase inhibitor family I36 protein n=1 Tax=Streptomyces sp. NPDC050523 TaxID=3365622 RepID=UPI00378B9DC7
MKIRSMAVASVALLASLPAVAAAQPADVGPQRGSGLEACRPGYLCLYENWQYNQGASARILRTNEDIGRLDDMNFNDITSAVYNNTDQVVRIYPHFDYQGVPVTLMPDEHMSFDGVNGTFNDVASSVQFLGWRTSRS